MEPLPSVEAARGQRAAARDLAEAKGLEARELVRQRYFELIESADAIVALSVAAKEVSDFVEGVEGRVAHALALSDDSPDPSEKSWRLEAVEAEPAAAIVATAPYLWRALDMDDHATAARIFVDCKSYSQRLRKAQRATLTCSARARRTQFARIGQETVR
ncbi:hypothetical protein M885DRAFT_498783 [Pelagophyceae sp. CCMP2097]|nr:hypothetical protein M885DRAFT_498783 [Pelagophyceae sp. CCMP2097]